MADNHGAHQTGEAWVVSLVEDFCKSPVAPVGYMIAGQLAASIFEVTTVRGCGTPVLNLDSRITTVVGNEAGVGGGVISGVNVGMCKPISNYTSTVRAKGQSILGHDTIMDMNCAGPNGVGNVPGKIKIIPPKSSSQIVSSDVGEHSGGIDEHERPPWPAEEYVNNPDPNGDPIPVYKNIGLEENGVYSVDGKGPYIILQPHRSPAELSATLAHEHEHAYQDYANRIKGQDALDGDIGDTIAGELGARRKAIENIENNPDLTREQKDKMIEKQRDDMKTILGGGSRIYEGIWYNYCQKMRRWEARSGQKSPYGQSCDLPVEMPPEMNEKF